MRLAALAVGLAATIAGCGSTSRAPLHPGDGGGLSGSDAPYELANDNDLAWVRLQYDAMVEGTPERTARRTELAGEYARRIQLRFDQDRRDDAHKAMLDLISLWSPIELAGKTAGAGMAPYRDQVNAVRVAFARAGGEQQAVAALAAMMVIDPAGASGYAAEIQEVFRYADDLSVAQYGEGAQRARPIQILEAVAWSFPSPYVVDRLVELYQERQRAIESHFKRNGADFEVIRAHGPGVLKTAWNIARLHARARRLGDAPAAIDALTGFGDDADLRAKLRAALARNAGPEAWSALAASFRPVKGDPDEGDQVAAFAIDFEAARRFPRSAASLFAAAHDALELGSTPLATWLYERGLEIQPGNATAASALCRLYEVHVSTYAQADRPHAAQSWLDRFERFYAAGAKRWKKPVRPDLAEGHAAIGRGLIGQGAIDRARAHLRRSIEIRPTLAALESLGMLELKLDNYDEAIAQLRSVLALKVENLTFEFDRARVLREIGEAYEAAGDPKRAQQSYRLALASWNSLASRAEFREPFLAEALVENAKLQWRLGHKDDALTLFEEAVDLDPNGATTHTDVVSFLIVRDEYERALDAYHRALGSHDIAEYSKVYMSLWVIGESRRTGRSEDPLALTYLTQRDGTLWYDELARFASGRSGVSRLTSRANTRGRRAEMLYYTAVLGDARQDPVKMRSALRDVVASNMVMFFEYDMAKHWLDRSSTASRRR